MSKKYIYLSAVRVCLLFGRRPMYVVIPYLSVVCHFSLLSCLREAPRSYRDSKFGHRGKSEKNTALLRAHRINSTLAGLRSRALEQQIKEKAFSLAVLLMKQMFDFVTEPAIQFQTSPTTSAYLILIRWSSHQLSMKTQMLRRV